METHLLVQIVSVPLQNTIFTLYDGLNVTLVNGSTCLFSRQVHILCTLLEISLNLNLTVK